MQTIDDDCFSDIRIPEVLINEENRILEESLRQKSNDLSRKQSEIDEDRDRIRLIEEHRKIVEEEIRMIEVFFLAFVVEKKIIRNFSFVFRFAESFSRTKIRQRNGEISN